MIFGCVSEGFYLPGFHGILLEGFSGFGFRVQFFTLRASARVPCHCRVYCLGLRRVFSGALVKGFKVSYHDRYL